MKLAIVGCRSYDDYKYFCSVINDYLSSSGTGEDKKDLEIVSGGASGVDSLARKYALDHKCKFTEFPADWKKYGRIAGPLRNTFIVSYMDECIAFPSKKSVGTLDTINKAKLSGKK